MSARRPIAGTKSAKYRGQALVLIALTAAYGVGTLQVMGSWLLVVSGVALPALGVAVGVLFSRAGFPLTLWEPIGLWFVGPLALSWVGMQVEFPIRLEWEALMTLASFIMLGAWAIHRLPMRLGKAPGVGLSVAMGVATGIGLTITVTPLLLFNEVSGMDPSFSMTDFGLLAAGYLLAGALGGLAVGVLRSLANLALTRMLVGIAAVTVIYAAVSLAIDAIEPSGDMLTEAVRTGVEIGLYAGPFAALLVYVMYEQGPRAVNGGRGN